jgi:DNA modification methylase
MQKDVIIQADCRDGLKQLPDRSVNCCITSPPYWGLRNYGVPGQLGLEKTPAAFVSNIVEVLSDVHRVLRDDGTLWLNLGDSYASGSRNRTPEQANTNSTITGSLKSQEQSLKQISKIVDGLKAKDLVGIPWMVAFALRSAGWYLRQEIIWAKAYSTNEENHGSVMPESVKDRFVKSHEQIFLFSKSPRYYFDIEAIKKDIRESSVQRLSQNVDQQKGSERVPGKTNGTMKAVAAGDKLMARIGTNLIGHSGDIQTGVTANKRSVWHNNPSGFKEAHFATFPEELIVDCIKAGCPEGGVILDPFMGAGTTALVASKLHRHFIGFELNPEYIKIAENRLKKQLGMFCPEKILNNNG